MHCKSVRWSGSGKRRFVCPGFVRRKEKDAHLVLGPRNNGGPGERTLRTKARPWRLQSAAVVPRRIFAYFLCVQKVGRRQAKPDRPFLLALSKEMGSGKTFFKDAILETVKGGAFAVALEMGSGKTHPQRRQPLAYFLLRKNTCVPP